MYVPVSKGSGNREAVTFGTTEVVLTQKVFSLLNLLFVSVPVYKGDRHTDTVKFVPTEVVLT